MKYRHSVLLLVDPAFEATYINRLLAVRDFFPGVRTRNYLELLGGQGVTYEVVDITHLSSCTLVAGDVRRYSAAILTSPLSRMDPRIWTILEQASFDLGITLVADAFLLPTGTPVPAFGIQSCGLVRARIPTIRNSQNERLTTTRFLPFSAKGPDFGVRPILRLLMQSWFSRRLHHDPQCEVPASFVSGRPALLRCRFGKAWNYLLNAHPSLALQEPSGVHGQIRDIVLLNPDGPAVSIELSGLACLRLDDPGSCERAHLDGLNPGVLSRELWTKLLAFLATQDAHVTVAYVPQWVDDGDPRRGTLTCNGHAITNRTPGAHYNSWQVVYSRRGRTCSHDYVAEYESICQGVRDGGLSVVSHGLTHMTTDVAAWLNAADRYSRLEWFREFREMAGGRAISKEEMIERMRRGTELIAEIFGRRTQVLVPAAHEMAAAIPDLAREAGLRLLAGRFTYLLHKNQIVSNRKVAAFYPEDMARGIRLIEAGYPVTLVFHDYDIFHFGEEWLAGRLAQMRRAGVRRFVPLEELGALLMMRVEATREENRLFIHVDCGDSLEAACELSELRLRIHAPATSILSCDPPNTVSVEASESRSSLLHLVEPKFSEGQLYVCVELRETGQDRPWCAI